MSTPSGKFYDVDLEVDLRREWYADRGSSLSTSTLGRVSLVIAAASLGLLLGIVVGHLTAPAPPPAPRISDEALPSTPALLASHGLTEAERSVRRRLADVALSEAAEVVGQGLARGRGAGTPAAAATIPSGPAAPATTAGGAAAGAAQSPAATVPGEPPRGESETLDAGGRAQGAARSEAAQSRSHHHRTSGSMRWGGPEEQPYQRAVHSILEIEQTDPYRH